MAVRTFNNCEPEIAGSAWIDPCACVIGKVRICGGSSVWPSAVIRGDVNYITIGEDCNIQDGAILHVTHDGPFSPGGTPLSMGNGVTVGHRALLHACSIGDHCLIGMATVIMDGAELANEVMVGAGSLIPPGKTLEARHLYVGTPAVKKRQLTDEELELLRYSAQHYKRLAQQHRDSTSK